MILLVLGFTLAKSRNSSSRVATSRRIAAACSSGFSNCTKEIAIRKVGLIIYYLEGIKDNLMFKFLHAEHLLEHIVQLILA
jgi:hypothetical protein